MHHLMYCLHYHSANNCDGIFNIDHAVGIWPEGWTRTGVFFSVTCDDGYSLSESDTNIIICDENNKWENKPQCNGNLQCNVFIFNVQFEELIIHDTVLGGCIQAHFSRSFFLPFF